MTGFAPDVRDGILLRDGGLCAMLGTPGCRGQKADEANHRLNRGMGGTSLEAVSSHPSNGCALEHDCNWRLEHSAEFAEAGRRRGVKLEAGQDPLSVPMWSVFFRQWVAFDVAGGMHLTGDVDVSRDARAAVLHPGAGSGFFIEWKEAA